MNKAKALAVRVGSGVNNRVALVISSLSVVLGFLIMSGGVSGAVGYTASSIVTSVTALGTTGVSDIMPILLAVAGVGILLTVAIVGIKMVYKFLQSRRHAPT